MVDELVHVPALPVYPPSRKWHLYLNNNGKCLSCGTPRQMASVEACPPVQSAGLESKTKRYFLQMFNHPQIEVSQAEYCQAEQSAGFHPKPGCGPEATGSFGNGTIRGWIVYETEQPKS